MGKMQRRKGRRVEQELVRTLKGAGLKAWRVPYSGSMSQYKGDVIVEGLACEVKARRAGFSSLYDWLENVKFLFLLADRREFLVVSRLPDWLRWRRQKRNCYEQSLATDAVQDKEEE